VRRLKSSANGIETPGSIVSEIDQQQPRPPGLRLSPRWLTLSLIAVTLIPVTLAATVWLAVPSTPEPKLGAEVHLEPVAWPRDGGTDVRLMPGVRVHNPTDQRWTNLSMGINNQFYFYSPDPLDAGQDFSVPLSFFRTSGNQAYRPTSVRIKKLTVYAQLPSGRRAIFEMLQPQSSIQ
jgi:hypothetical protein